MVDGVLDWLSQPTSGEVRWARPEGGDVATLTLRIVLPEK